MALQEVPLGELSLDLTSAAKTLLEEAGRREEALLAEHKIPAFVPCDYALVYAGLVEVQRRSLAPGRRFCEWGSGMGVVACLAAMLDYSAAGIEIQPALLRQSRQLSEDFSLQVEWALGTFVPAGAEDLLDLTDDFAWLEDRGDDAYDELGVDPQEFDLVFAFPWPGEEHVVEKLFDYGAASGALLMTYRGREGLALSRKVGEFELDSEDELDRESDANDDDHDEDSEFDADR
jgi:hypothetical protein